MKKIYFVLILLWFMIFSVKAEAITVILDLNAGWNYNDLIYKKFKDNKRDLDHFMREDLNSGQGFYLEEIYWINNKWGLGLGFDKVVTSWSGESESPNGKRIFEYIYQISGPYTSLKYIMNDNIRLKANFIYYNYSEHYNRKYSWQDEEIDRDLERGNGLGIILGSDIAIPIKKGFIFNGGFGYRMVEIDLTEKYSDLHGEMISNSANEKLEITGLTISAGISYKF